MAEDAQTEKLKVFVSYSRADVAFADQLVCMLQDRGFDPIIDRHDIDPAEPWKERLGAMIFACDKVVFVLTEKSAGSPVCHWEVEHAASLDKPMIPITIGPIQGVEPPPLLKELNYIYFYSDPEKPGSGFYDGVLELESALNTNRTWMRQQTRLMERAAQYKADPSDAILMRGTELARALAWVTEAPKKAHIRSEVSDFIRMSEEAEALRNAAAKADIEAREEALKRAEDAVAKEKIAEARRKRATRIGMIVAGALTLIAIAIAVFAVLQTFAADEAAEQAIAERRETQRTESRLIASVADQLIEDNQHEKAVALARAVLPLDVTNDEDRPLTSEPIQTLYDGLHHNYPLRVMRGHEDSVLGAKQLKDGRFLTWSVDRTARLWSAEGEPLAVLEGHERLVNGAEQLADGRFLTWSGDGTARLWSAEGEPLGVLSGHEGWVRGAEPLEDGRFLTWSVDRTARLWSAEGEPLAVLEGHERSVNGAEQLEDGRFLTWSNDSTARLWSAEGEPLAVLEGHERLVIGAEQLEDGRFLTWSVDRTARLWNAEGEPLAVLEGHEGSVNGAEPLKDGRFLTWSDDSTARLWSAEGEPLAVLEGHERLVIGAEQLEDRRFLTWSVDSSARLWSAEGEPLTVLDVHEGPVRGAKPLEDGRFLTWSDDSTARLWSAEGEPLAVLEGHEGWVRGAEQLEDGRFLTWSNDSTARLWSAEGEPTWRPQRT